MMESSTLMYSDLINSVETIQEAQELSSEIDILLASIFENQGKSFDNSLRIISIRSAAKIREAFSKNNLDSTNKEVIRDFLLTLKAGLTKFKIIKLTIAFEPSSETIENISNWVKTNLGSLYILDINTNKSILGGAIIVFKGLYRDLTLKKGLEEVFKTRRDEILKPIQ